jgi:serine/threonine-protein kinase RsbW
LPERNGARKPGILSSRGTVARPAIFIVLLGCNSVQEKPERACERGSDGGAASVTRRRFETPNRIEESAALAQELEAFGLSHGVPLSVINDLNVVLDEIVTNVISYGYADGAEHVIVIDVDVADGAVVVEVVDDGVAFDPVAEPAPDLRGSLRERRIGGLGIQFVKHLTDSCSYCRVDGKNHLRIMRRLGV